MDLQLFKNMVRFSRSTGYFQHDIRDPERYEDPQDGREFIQELDQAFIDAANEVKAEPEIIAGYGESDESMKVSDSLVDNLLAIDDDGRFLRMKTDIYDEAMPGFKASMIVWSENLEQESINDLNSYWSTRINA